MREWLAWEQPAQPVSNGISHTSITSELFCGGSSDAELQKRFRLFCKYGRAGWEDAPASSPAFTRVYSVHVHKVMTGGPNLRDPCLHSTSVDVTHFFTQHLCEG